jgi:hypothetical protein
MLLKFSPFCLAALMDTSKLPTSVIKDTLIKHKFIVRKNGIDLPEINKGSGSNRQNEY